VGLERLVLLLSQNELLPEPPQWYLAILTPIALATAFKIAGTFWGRGQSLACDWQAGSLKSRLKKADKMRAQKVLMLGEDELNGSYVTVRDLATGQQEQIPLESL
jgi:histidyl-tRNA synthetase